MDKILNYIDGKLVEPISGNYLDNYNPSTGRLTATTFAGTLVGSSSSCSGNATTATTATNVTVSANNTNNEIQSTTKTNFNIFNI